MSSDLPRVCFECSLKKTSHLQPSPYKSTQTLLNVLHSFFIPRFEHVSEQMLLRYLINTQHMHHQTKFAALLDLPFRMKKTFSNNLDSEEVDMARGVIDRCWSFDSEGTHTSNGNPTPLLCKSTFHLGEMICRWIYNFCVYPKDCLSILFASMNLSSYYDSNIFNTDWCILGLPMRALLVILSMSPSYLCSGA